MMARSPRSRELVGLFAPFAVVVGVLNPTFEYGDLRITRITDLVPFWILFGVLGLESLWRAWTSLGPAAARVFRVLTVALVALGAAWNLRATLVVMPAAGPTNLSVLALKTMQESPPTKQVWACLENWGPVGLFAPLYRQGARFHGLGTQEFLERATRMDFGPDDRLLFAVSRRPRCPEKVFGWFRAFYPGLIVTALPREGDLPQVFSCDIPPALAAGAFTPAPGARRVSLRDLLYFTEPCTGEDDESFGTTPAGEPVRVAGSREADAWARGRDTVLLMPVSPGFTTFESFVVLGDVPDGSPEAAAVFRVELNGRPVGKEVRVMAGDAPVPLVVPLGGARILGLKSRWFAGPFERLLPVWLHPSLVRAGPGLDSDQTEAPR
jgi:hypothetical protein